MKKVLKNVAVVLFVLLASLPFMGCPDPVSETPAPEPTPTPEPEPEPEPTLYSGVYTDGNGTEVYMHSNNTYVAVWPNEQGEVAFGDIGTWLASGVLLELVSDIEGNMPNSRIISSKSFGNESQIFTHISSSTKDSDLSVGEFVNDSYGFEESFYLNSNGTFDFFEDAALSYEGNWSIAGNYLVLLNTDANTGEIAEIMSSSRFMDNRDFLFRLSN